MHVVYGLVGFKTHCKVALVVRRERGVIRRYVHLSTGNYNAITAHLYTDVGLFTTDDAVTGDVARYGLRSMHERAAAIGATLDVRPGWRGGVLVALHLPLAGHVRPAGATVGAR